MNSKTIAIAQRELKNKLSVKYQDPILCDQYAWWILEAITKKKKEFLIIDDPIKLNDKQSIQCDDWLKKIVEENMPLQYLLGSVPFLDLEILVETPILIPRPETEEMCDEFIKQLQQLRSQKLTILDIGTGTGAIALSFAKALPKSIVYGVDISEQALNLAEKNKILNKINNVCFLESDVYKNISSELLFDLIISNPPYITTQEWETLDDSVKQWEDKRALVAEDQGLAIIKKIITGAPKHIKQNTELQHNNIPQLIIEIGYQQGQSVSKLFQMAGFDDITIKKDLEGKDRVVTGRIDYVAIQKKTN